MMRNDDRNDDIPPFSRLFVVCSKNLKKKDLQPVFEKYGTVERIHMPTDRNTGESKGIAYVKYSKTSFAAAAIDALHLTTIEGSTKPLKVMVSSYKSEDNNTNELKFKRLFIKVQKDATKEEISEHFSKFGKVASVHLQKDKKTDECKGFAYVNYHTFRDAAVAFEECDRSYRPIFATPKDELKRTRNNMDNFESCHSSNSNIWRDHMYQPPPIHEDNNKNENIVALMKNTHQNFDTVSVVCSPIVGQRYLESLFSIIPGMVHLKYSLDVYNGVCKASVKYSSEAAAGHACETLNNFEFPSGEVLTVKPDDNPLAKVASNLSEMVNSFKKSMAPPDLMQLADAIEQASSLIKAATSGIDKSASNSHDKMCNVDLPPPKPLAPKDSKVAQRCFLVFKPAPPPLRVLQDVFSRFGDLIDVIVYPRKTFGFARYASTGAAQNAMATLHQATVYGVTLKVLEATEKDHIEHDIDMKRPKIETDSIEVTN